jgi:chemotaxis protein MotB
MMLAHRVADDDAESIPALLDLGWDAEQHDDTWLVSYADLISTTLAMVVMLFGRAALTPAPSTAALVLPRSAATAQVVVPAPPPRAALALPAPAASSTADAAPAAASQPTPESRLAALVTARFAGKISAEQRNEGVVLTIPEVALFDSARAQLHASALPLLHDLADTLREVGEAQISIEGHTDNRPVLGGEFRSNWELAAARGIAVTRFFLEQGFAPQRLHSVSYADTRPVADNATAEGRAANRRVELAIEFTAADGRQRSGRTR